MNDVRKVPRLILRDEEVDEMVSCLGKVGICVYLMWYRSCVGDCDNMVRTE